MKFTSVALTLALALPGLAIPNPFGAPVSLEARQQPGCLTVQSLTGECVKDRCRSPDYECRPGGCTVCDENGKNCLNCWAYCCSTGLPPPPEVTPRI
ncbi:uncharacterized protein L3040_004359 [Drepanopeziza brunnea f. sp. 'multigermtubi']|uniref:uncharacterized protein n=1 Tax=Drepanopeziza brunnea f. sp. 'multigermtubi' TaxID=698441 RepID=UPI0023898B96|nr:hypothetical protein L3040_004359 [Drepanopeziza brunnea f. sp. 'multigermtubi']